MNDALQKTKKLWKFIIFNFFLIFFQKTVAKYKKCDKIETQNISRRTLSWLTKFPMIVLLAARALKLAPLRRSLKVTASTKLMLISASVAVLA